MNQHEFVRFLGVVREWVAHGHATPNWVDLSGGMAELHARLHGNDDGDGGGLAPGTDGSVEALLLDLHEQAARITQLEAALARSEGAEKRLAREAAEQRERYERVKRVAASSGISGAAAHTKLTGGGRSVASLADAAAACGGGNGSGSGGSADAAPVAAAPTTEQLPLGTAAARDAFRRVAQWRSDEVAAATDAAHASAKAREDAGAAGLHVFEARAWAAAAQTLGKSKASLIAKKLAHFDVAEFRKHDADRSGAIARWEFLAMWRKSLHVKKASLSDGDLGLLWDAIDADGAGQIEEIEYRRFLIAVREWADPGAAARGAELKLHERVHGEGRFSLVRDPVTGVLVTGGGDAAGAAQRGEEMAKARRQVEDLQIVLRAMEAERGALIAALRERADKAAPPLLLAHAMSAQRESSPAKPAGLASPAKNKGASAATLDTTATATNTTANINDQNPAPPYALIVLRARLAEQLGLDADAARAAQDDDDVLCDAAAALRACAHAAQKSVELEHALLQEALLAGGSLSSVNARPSEASSYEESESSGGGNAWGGRKVSSKKSKSSLHRQSKASSSKAGGSAGTVTTNVAATTPPPPAAMSDGETSPSARPSTPPPKDDEGGETLVERRDSLKYTMRVRLNSLHTIDDQEALRALGMQEGHGTSSGGAGVTDHRDTNSGGAGLTLFESGVRVSADGGAQLQPTSTIHNYGRLPSIGDTTYTPIHKFFYLPQTDPRRKDVDGTLVAYLRSHDGRALLRRTVQGCCEKAAMLETEESVAIRHTDSAIKRISITAQAHMPGGEAAWHDRAGVVAANSVDTDKSKLDELICSVTTAASRQKLFDQLPPAMRAHLTEPSFDDECDARFDRLDEDGNGVIDAEELYLVVVEMARVHPWSINEHHLEAFADIFASPGSSGGAPSPGRGPGSPGSGSASAGSATTKFQHAVTREHFPEVCRVVTAIGYLADRDRMIKAEIAKLKDERSRGVTSGGGSTYSLGEVTGGAPPGGRLPAAPLSQHANTERALVSKSPQSTPRRASGSRRDNDDRGATGGVALSAAAASGQARRASLRAPIGFDAGGGSDMGGDPTSGGRRGSGGADGTAKKPGSFRLVEFVQSTACDEIELEKQRVEAVLELVRRQGPRAIDRLITTRMSAEIKARVKMHQWVEQVEGLFDELVEAAVGTVAANSSAAHVADDGSGRRGSHHSVSRGSRGSEDSLDEPDLELTFVELYPLLSCVNDESLQLGAKGGGCGKAAAAGGGRLAAMTETRFRHMVDAFDTDGNGVISRDEFVDFVKFCILMSHLDQLDDAGLAAVRAESGSEGAFKRERKSSIVRSSMEAAPVLMEDEDEDDEGGGTTRGDPPTTASDSVSAWEAACAAADGAIGAVGTAAEAAVLAAFGMLVEQIRASPRTVAAALPRLPLPPSVRAALGSSAFAQHCDTAFSVFDVDKDGCIDAAEARGRAIDIAIELDSSAGSLSVMRSTSALHTLREQLTTNSMMPAAAAKASSFTYPDDDDDDNGYDDVTTQFTSSPSAFIQASTSANRHSMIAGGNATTDGEGELPARITRAEFGAFSEWAFVVGVLSEAAQKPELVRALAAAAYAMGRLVDATFAYGSATADIERAAALSYTGYGALPPLAYDDALYRSELMAVVTPLDELVRRFESESAKNAALAREDVALERNLSPAEIHAVIAKVADVHPWGVTAEHALRVATTFAAALGDHLLATDRGVNVDDSGNGNGSGAALANFAQTVTIPRRALVPFARFVDALARLACARAAGSGSGSGSANGGMSSAQREAMQKLELSDAWSATSAALDRLARDAELVNEAADVLPPEVRAALDESAAEVAAKAVARLDADGSSALAPAELLPLLTELSDGAPWAVTREHCERFARMFDTNADGVLQPAELEAFVRLVFVAAALHQRAALLAAADAAATLGARVDELIYRCSADREHAFRLLPQLPQTAQAAVERVALDCAARFDALDADASGALTPDEVFPIIVELIGRHAGMPPLLDDAALDDAITGWAVTYDDCERFMALFDADGNGALERSEFSLLARFIAIMAYLESMDSTPLVELDRQRVAARVRATLDDAAAWPQLVPLLPLDVRQWLLDVRFAARSMFAELDADGSGDLSPDELYPLLVQLADAAAVPWAVTWEHCTAFTAVFDAGGTGALELDDFADLAHFVLGMAWVRENLGGAGYGGAGVDGTGVDSDLNGDAYIGAWDAHFEDEYGAAITAADADAARELAAEIVGAAGSLSDDAQLFDGGGGAAPLPTPVTIDGGGGGDASTASRQSYFYLAEQDINLSDANAARSLRERCESNPRAAERALPRLPSAVQEALQRVSALAGGAFDASAVAAFRLGSGGAEQNDSATDEVARVAAAAAAVSALPPDTLLPALVELAAHGAAAAGYGGGASALMVPSVYQCAGFIRQFGTPLRADGQIARAEFARLARYIIVMTYLEAISVPTDVELSAAAIDQALDTVSAATLELDAIVASLPHSLKAQLAELRAFSSEAFDAVDANGDGVLSADELLNTMGELVRLIGEASPIIAPPSDDQLRRFIGMFDLDGDGVLSRDEFPRLLEFVIVLGYLTQMQRQVEVESAAGVTPLESSNDANAAAAAAEHDDVLRVAWPGQPEPPESMTPEIVAVGFPLPPPPPGGGATPPAASHQRKLSLVAPRAVAPKPSSSALGDGAEGDATATADADVTGTWGTAIVEHKQRRASLGLVAPTSSFSLVAVVEAPAPAPGTFGTPRPTKSGSAKSCPTTANDASANATAPPVEGNQEALLAVSRAFAAREERAVALRKEASKIQSRVVAGDMSSATLRELADAQDCLAKLVAEGARRGSSVGMMLPNCGIAGAAAAPQPRLRAQADAPAPPPHPLADIAALPTGDDAQAAATKMQAIQRGRQNRAAAQERQQSISTSVGEMRRLSGTITDQALGSAIASLSPPSTPALQNNG